MLSKRHSKDDEDGLRQETQYSLETIIQLQKVLEKGLPDSPRHNHACPEHDSTVKWNHVQAAQTARTNFKPAPNRERLSANNKLFNHIRRLWNLALGITNDRPARGGA
jgi:hypothetical protein